MVVYALVYLSALIVGCGYAFARGGSPERWGAGIVVASMVLSNLAGLRSGHLFLSTDTALFLIDTLETVALVVLACRANRFWPLWVAMFQLDAVFVHIVMYADATPPFSYGFALKAAGLPLPIMVGIGAWRYRRRERALAA